MEEYSTNQSWAVCVSCDIAFPVHGSIFIAASISLNADAPLRTFAALPAAIFVRVKGKLMNTVFGLIVIAVEWPNVMCSRGSTLQVALGHMVIGD
jgi:hypothetical protein